MGKDSLLGNLGNFEALGISRAYAGALPNFLLRKFTL